MKPSELLIAAKGLIDAPEKWTTGLHPKPRMTSMIIAVIDAAKVGSHQAKTASLESAFHYLRKAVGTHRVGAWSIQPERTWEEVMSVFDRAIAAAQEAGE